MPRYENPYARYPTDPSAAVIGNNLAMALFGDPEARAQAQLRRAQTQQAEATAAYERSKMQGQIFQNGNAMMLPQYAAEGIYQEGEPVDAAPDMPGFARATVSGTPVAPAVAPAVRAPAGGYTSDSVSGIVRSLYPGAVITSGARDPNSPLGRANPRSYHNTGQAIDMRAIPGVTFDQMRDRLAAAGVPIAEAIDEYAHPSPHSTGGHWHFGFNGNGAVQGGNVHIPGATTGVSATVSAPTLAAEPGSRVLDIDKYNRLVGALLGAGQGANLDKAVAALLAIGGDKNARAALVAQGHAPGKDFAMSRAAQLNNEAVDQYGGLAKAALEGTLTQTGSTQRTNIEQAGQDRRNAADNASREGIEARKLGEERRRDDMQYGPDKTGKGPAKFPASQLGKIDDEINAQLSGSAGKPVLDPALQTAVRVRAIEIGQRTGNPAGAVQQAISELVDVKPGEKHWYGDGATTYTPKQSNPKVVNDPLGIR